MSDKPGDDNRDSLGELNPNSGPTQPWRPRAQVVHLVPNTWGRIYTYMCPRPVPERVLPPNTPEVRAWDGKPSKLPVAQYLEKARGGLDPVRGEQWGYRVAQSLPDAALNEVGGAVVGKVVGPILGRLANSLGRDGVVIVARSYKVGFRRAHILNRHRAGTGISGKTEFPRSWDDDKIIREIESVASDVNSKSGMGKWNSPYRIGVRDGIEIRVDFFSNGHGRFGGQISTGFPINTPVNP